MKFKNEMIVICLILFILISMTAVSAVDNNTNIITHNNNDNNDIISINSSSNNEILTGANDGSFADLNTKINGDSSTDIVLDKDYTYSSKDTIKDGIAISKNNIIIDGQGHKIDAKGQSRIFNITGTTVTLKNIIFTNGMTTTSGGAIRDYGDNLRIFNCTFIDNTASSWGGAIFSYPDSYSVYVNSTFINNKANVGGAVASYNYVGYSANIDYVSYGARHDIINCTFDSNTATGEGGALTILGELEKTERPNNDIVNIRSCVFTNNEAPKGDAISNKLSAYINMTDSIILGNPEEVIYSWGAMFFADYNWWGNTVNDASVKPNITKGVKFTKWLYMDFVPDISKSSATVSINNLYNGETGEVSTLSTNKLPSINAKFSGVNATFEVGNADLDHTGKYEANFVLLGDAVLTTNIEGISISKKIKIGGLSELGLLIRNADDDSVIKLDKDYVYTPGVDLPNHNIIIGNKHNIVIDGNGHTVNGMGKTMLFAVDKDSSEITFKNMKIVNGHSNDDYDGAAGLILAVNTKFINCTFVNNTAEGIGTGGALHVNAMNVSIADCKFISNAHTTSSAGAVFIRGENAKISNTLFENNTANAYHARAGALLLYDGGSVENCTFIHNTADYAGATYNYGHTDMDYCTFINNIALSDTLLDDGGFSGGAGAVYALNTTITNSRFINNTAIAGAAIVFASPLASADRCLFVNNTATSPNGIILGIVAGGSVSNSIFLDNDVAYHSYIISTIYGKLKADDNWFGNIAKNYDSNWDVSNLAEMSRWLFVNATNPVFSDDGKSLTVQFNFFVYDSNTKNVVPYDSDDLPEFKFTVSAQNLTLAKNEFAPEEPINGNLTYHISIGEEGYVYRYDYKGTVTAQYENVKYVVPFSYQQNTWFEANSTFEVMKDEYKYLDFTLHPFEQDYLPFLNKECRLTYKINDTSIATFNKDTGRIRGLKVGVTTMFIKFDGKDVMGRDKYTPSNITILINVTKSGTQIFNSTSIPEVLNVGENAGNNYVVFNLKNFANRSVSGNYELEFINNSPDVLQIVSTGPHSFFFKTIGEGIANFTVRFNGNDEYLASSKDYTFTVGRMDPQLSVSPESISMMLGSYYYIDIQSKCPKNFTYVYSNPDVAVLEDEVIHAIGDGLTKITIKFAGDDKYLPATTYLIVNVTAVKTYIDVNETFNIIPNSEMYLGACLRDMDGKLISYALNYTSNNTSVVTVDESGFIHSIFEGTAKITISSNGFSEYLPATTDVIVKVEIGKSEITVNSPVELQYRHSTSLGAVLNHDGELLYVSSNPEVVSVNNKTGFITANRIGEATITVSYNGTEQYEPCSTNVTVKVVKASTSINVENTFAGVIDSIGQIIANLIPRNAGSLTFKSNDENIIEVNDKGIVSAVGTGKTTITVSFAGNENYTASNETIDVTVYPSNIPTSIEVNKNFDLHVGDVVDIGAVLSPSKAGNLTYVSSDSSIVSVDENGLITAKKVGEATVTVSFAGNSRYLANSTKVNVKVTKVPTVISVDGDVGIVYNQKTNLNATLNHEGDLVYISSDVNVVKVDKNGNIGAKSIGEATITISYAGSDKFESNSTKVNVKVTKAPTTIDVDKTFACIIGSDDVIVAALSPDVGSLTFKSNDENIVKVNNDGEVTPVSVGKATVLISYAGNDYYMAANETVEVSVYASVIPTSIEVNKTINLHIDDVVDIGAVLNPANAGELTYSSNNSDVVSVDEDGKLTAKKVGEATITVSFAGNNKFLANSTKVNVKVTKASSVISVEPDLNLVYNQSTNLNATLNHDGKLYYRSSNTNVVIVDAGGTVTANGVGEATITISYIESDNFAGNSTKVNVKVTKAPTSIDVDKSVALIIDNTGIIEAALNPDVGRLTFKSNNESIVKVDRNGNIRAVGVGKTTILVSYAGNARYMASNETVDVTVYSIEIPTSIEVNKTIDMYVDDSISIGALLDPSNAGKLTYESSNLDVVSVDANGKITAKKVGKATVTVSFAGNDRYAAASEDVLVKVSLIPTSIEAVDTVSVNLTESAYLKYTFSHPRAGQLKFIMNDVSIASISNGRVTGDKVGKTTLNIIFEGNEKYASSNATVDVIVSDVETSIDATDSIEVNLTETADIVAILNPKQAGKLRFVSNNKDVISVDRSGEIRGIKVGSGTVSVIFDGSGKYRASNKTIFVTVKDVVPTIEVNDSIKVNVTETAAIGATVNPEEAGQLKYTTDSDIISINSKGNVKGLKVGTANVTLTLSAHGKYRAANKTVTVTVSEVETSINVETDDIDMVYGEKTTINATLAPDNVGKLIFTSNDNEVVTVDENGVVRTIKPGVAAITISYDGKGKYKSANKTVTVNVGRAPSSIEINDTMDLEIGIGFILRPTTNPTGIELTYSSSDEETVMVENGFVFPVKYGTAVITIDFAGNEYYLPSNATINVTISSVVTEILVNDTITLGFGESKGIGSKIHVPHVEMIISGKLKYVSSNPEIASVDEETGLITANSVGNTTIFIYYEGTNIYEPSNATVNVEVTTRTTSIKVDQHSISLYVDDTQKINASLINGPEGAKLTYMSNNPNVVRINPLTGEMTAVGEGNATVTVTYSGDDEYHSSSANIAVSVSKYKTHVKAKTSYEMKVFDEMDLNAVVMPNEGVLTYTSSDEDVVTVNSKGCLSAKKAGNAIITINFAGDRKYLPSQKEVIVSVSKVPTSINLTDIHLFTGQEYKLDKVVLPDGVPTRAKYYEYISWDTEVFDVDNGLITAFHEGSSELYVGFLGDDIYLPSNKTVMVTVDKKILSADEYNFTVEVDDDAGEATFTLIVPEDVEGTLMVTLNGEVYAEPVDNGKAVVVIDELKPGDYKAALRYTGDENYASINNDTKFHIGKYKIDKNKDVDVLIGGTAVYTVHLTKDTQAMENKTIKFKVNGKTYYAVTNRNGYASIKVKLPSVKHYKVTAQFASLKVSNKIKVHIIKAKDVKTSKRSDNLKVKVTLKKLNKKYLSKKKVTLKFNGKTYTAKTNNKGVVTFTLKKSLFAKLKAGKSYKYTIKYSKDSVTKTIKLFK